MVDCVTLWIGDSLGAVERACLRSILRQGHSLALYCYDRLDGVPEGVEVRDAADVLPKEAIVRHRNGSAALFSDWFRYELQCRGLGTWLDVDNYLVAPLDMKEPYLFGKEIVDAPGFWRKPQRELIAAGVLRLPPTSPMLPSLVGLFDGRTVPDWTPSRWTPWYKFRGLIGYPPDLSDLPWGTAGPFAVDALADRHGLSSLALPSDVFNPVPWYEASWILNPAITVEQVVTERTVSVHLCNDCIKDFKNDPAPTGSFLERLQSEGA